MNRIIEIQFRLLVGTVIMWVMGMLIFGSNLVSYGITHVIRMGFYVQGAFLIITMVGWINILPGMFYDLIDWIHEVNNKYRIFTRIVLNVASEFFSDEELGCEIVVETEMTNEMCHSDGTIDIEVSEISEEDFLLAVENKIREHLPPGVEDEKTRINLRKSMTKKEKTKFDSLWLALDNVETARIILSGDKFIKMGSMPGKDKAVPIPVIEAVTVEQTNEVA